MLEPVSSSLCNKYLRQFIYAGLIILVACHFAVKGQSCPTDGSGSHTIWAGITANGSSLASKAVVPVGTTLRIDAVVTTSGGCDTACTFFPNLVNHIAVTADISTNGSLNGSYTIGYVFGLNPNGSTGYFATLNTEASNSTGPVYFTPSAPGTYVFHIQGIIDRHPNFMAFCFMGPGSLEKRLRKLHGIRSHIQRTCHSIHEPFLSVITRPRLLQCLPLHLHRRQMH